MANTVVLEDCELKATSAKAFLIEHDGHKDWIPLSQIDFADPDCEFTELSMVGSTGNIVIPEWLATAKGWA